MGSPRNTCPNVGVLNSLYGKREPRWLMTEYEGNITLTMSKLLSRGENSEPELEVQKDGHPEPAWSWRSDG